MDLQIDPVLIREVCQASLIFVKEQATKKHIQLGFRLNDTRALMFGDAKRMKQVLVNLLTNAVKFTPAGGAVSLEVEADAEAGLARFAVRDTGIGIAPENLPRLFQPFVQLDSSLSRQHEGTGLGLALVRRLTELHGGSVSVESELGRGSCFTIVLPYPSEPALAEPATGAAEHPGSHEARRQAQGLALARPEVRAEAPAAPQPAPVRIMLVEDNELNIAATGDYLQDKGYKVTVARNGREALDIADEVCPDLILMDVQMPVMDGLEATRQLRARPAFARTPIIALTALAMPGDRERCLAAGASTYLTKPITLKGLVAAIEALLET
jgi:CheY-like chemotaxis protein